MIFFLNQNIFVKDLSVCFFLTFQIDSTSSTMDIYVSIYKLTFLIYLKKTKLF